MANTKESFISNLIGRNTYYEFKHYCKIIVVIGTIILGVIFTLSNFVYVGFVSNLLSLVTGATILFGIYVAAVIVLLDVPVKVEKPEWDYGSKTSKATKPLSYKLSTIWDIVLILLGVTAIFFSNKYKKHYAFECETFLVDTNSGIYHFDTRNGCKAKVSNSIKKMKGIELEATNYSLWIGVKIGLMMLKYITNLIGIFEDSQD